MKIIPSFFILIVLLIGQNVNAQTKQVILRIDTLIQKDFNHYFFIRTQNSKELKTNLISDSYCILEHLNNSVTCKVLLQNDSSTIQISLDENGGYLELSNLYNMRSDTIRISKFTVYDRPYPDTNLTTINYWYEEADTLGENFKNTKEFSVDKRAKKNSAPIKLQYNINGETYYCMSSWEKANYASITKFHGQGRTGLFRGNRPYYFHGTERSNVTVNKVYLRLKNGF